MSPPKMGAIVCKDIYWRVDLRIKLVPSLNLVKHRLHVWQEHYYVRAEGARGQGTMGHAADANSGQNVPDKYCQQEITFVRLSLAPQQPAASRWIVLELRQADGDIRRCANHRLHFFLLCFAVCNLSICLFLLSLS